MQQDKMTKLKRFLQSNCPNIQVFDTGNCTGDKMETIYDEDGIQVDYAPDYDYIEILGLTNEEFESLVEIEVIFDIFQNVRLKTFWEVM